MASHLLLIDCPDQPGLILRVMGILFQGGFNIISNHEFVDRETNHFFMRTEFTPREGSSPLIDQVESLLAALQEIETLLPKPARVRLAPTEKRRIVVLVTREHHCLAELLIRHAYNELGATIQAIIANHDTLAPLAARFAIPFHHIGNAGLERADHERRVLEAIRPYDPEYVVLAKYMRVLSPAFVAEYPDRIVNIHHSFLPAFIGANPYRQAFERGVKIIGATAHFVTAGLDEGPIIAQSVTPVDHSHSANDMAQMGHHIEKMVLANALRLVFEERIFLVGRRTIILD